MNSSNLYIDSEIGELEEVIIHTPGQEIEVITPLTAEKLLYNDIIPLSVVRKEYTILRDFLSLVAKTVEVKDVLLKVFQERENRIKLIYRLSRTEKIKARKDELAAMNPSDLCGTLISGLKSKKNTLSSFLSDEEFDYFPLPNLYFTRDSVMVFRDHFITGSMANTVREPEALLLQQIIEKYYNVSSEKQIYDGAAENDCNVTIEGGDFLVFSSSILIIGLSERTTSQAVDKIIDKLSLLFKTSFTVYCVILPKKRETIHLDMVFNIINKNEVLIYEPYITGESQLKFVKIDVDKTGGKKIRFIKSLIRDLKEAGYHLDTVYCGGDDDRLRQREQWLSGNNFFAFSPGKIIGYDCNEATLEALEKSGYAVCQAEKFIDRSEKVSDYEKLAVTIPGTDLARGGGGVRCMTLPVRRKHFEMGNN
ncbi:MAG: arginine deiminase family protein [Spirochaetia bacterium]|jgi:arginine deiminase|nr:arginine deiminase family protein [Spirochaetia bacterium]